MSEELIIKLVDDSDIDQTEIAAQEPDQRSPETPTVPDTKEEEVLKRGEVPPATAGPDSTKIDNVIDGLEEVADGMKAKAVEADATREVASGEEESQAQQQAGEIDPPDVSALEDLSLIHI